MRASPAPDVVTRAFMLFRGVAPGDTGLWGQAAARATAHDGATFWANVVGVDLVHPIADCSGFWNGAGWKSSDDLFWVCLRC